MKRIKIDVYLEWLFRLIIGTIFVSEWAGFQIAIFTPDLSIPLALFILWILAQAGVTCCLISQVWHAILGREKEAWRIFNVVVICIALQGWGIF
jgi:hypothetical protein